MHGCCAGEEAGKTSMGRLADLRPVVRAFRVRSDLHAIVSPLIQSKELSVRSTEYIYPQHHHIS